MRKEEDLLPEHDQLRVIESFQIMEVVSDESFYSIDDGIGVLFLCS